jgi:hypothetical protein
LNAVALIIWGICWHKAGAGEEQQADARSATRFGGAVKRGLLHVIKDVHGLRAVCGESLHGELRSV